MNRVAFNVKINDIVTNSSEEYFSIAKSKIRKILFNHMTNHSGIKYKIIVSSTFLKIDINDEDNYREFHFVPKYYNTLFNTSFIHNFNDQYNSFISEYNNWVDELTEYGSGYVFYRINYLNIKIVKINTLRGSSYIKLSFNSNALINIHNNDDKCFLWCILAHKYPANDHRTHVSKYNKYEKEINMKGIDYPVDICDIGKIEEMNNLSINVFGLEDINKRESIYPIRLSNTLSVNVIDLLYVEKDNDCHYMLIKDINKFLTFGNINKSLLCRNCLQIKSTDKALESHKDLCLGITKKYSLPVKQTLQFQAHHMKIRKAFVLYCTFDYSEKNIWVIYVKSDYKNIYESQYLIGKGLSSLVEKIFNIFECIKKEMNRFKTPNLTRSEERISKGN